MGKPGAALQSVRTKLQQAGEVEFLELEQISQVLTQLKGGEPLLLICSVSERKHILETIATLKGAKSHLIRKRLKVMVISAIKQPQILSKFHENGAQDIMTEPVTEKALELKLRRHLQASQKQRKDSAGLASRSLKSAAKAGTSPEADGRRSAAGGELAKRSEALSIQSDCWLLLSGVGKRVMGKWIFSLAGPSPTVARWVERKSTGDDSHWVWTPNADDGRFIKEKGSWIFRGQRPEVRGDVWAFVGKAPELAFVSPEGETLARRLHCDEQGQLYIAKDSSAALSQLALIRSTWDKIIKTKAEAEAEKREIRAKKKGGAAAEALKEDDPLHDAVTLETRDQSLGEESPEAESVKPAALDQSELLAAAGEVEGASQPEITETTDEIAKILEEEALKQAESMEPILEEEAMALALQDAEKEGAVDPSLEVTFEGQALKSDRPDTQIFKKERKKTKELRGEFEAEAASPELEGAFKKEAESPELRGEFAAEAESPELEATQEGAAASRELRGEFASDPLSPELKASEDAAALSPLLEAALRPEAGDTPEVQAELERLSEIAKQSKFKPADAVSTKPPKKAERKDFTPEMAESKNYPFKPQLTGLALVFLAGEQSCKTGRTLEEMAVKFCEYVNTSLAGTAVELWWMAGDGQVRCVGSDLGSRGTHEAIAREGFEGMRAGSVWFKASRAGNGVVPLEMPQGAKICLVLSGVCVDGMTEEYARALQTAVRGIALGVVESAKSVEQAHAA
jgi:CheY-like chemotaxis protein